MRPKPLMATLTLASVVVFTAAACKSECKGGRSAFRVDGRVGGGEEERPC